MKVAPPGDPPEYPPNFLIRCPFRQPPRLRYAEKMEIPPLQGRTAAVLTVSDRCFGGTQVDRSGPALRSVLEAEGAVVLQVEVVPDDIPAIVARLGTLVGGASLVLTTGGTGLSPRDNTPEATLAVCHRLVPGLSELIRSQGMLETPFAPLSRGVSGIVGDALVINLPGNPAGAVSGLRAVLPLLPHALDLVAGKTEHAMAPDAGG